MANGTPSNPAAPPLKQIAFAFPFRRKGQGNGGPSTDITDEHDMYLLLKQEPSGAFAVSGKGMWHGGIHLTEAGAGQSLDLKGGVRCIADGEVIAWRVNRNYPVSFLPSQHGQPAINAPYSTGFALVQHTMEFPRGSKLTFYSLYMHLQDYAAYESDPALAWPAYWSTKFEVTQDTVDRPSAANGQTAPVEQIGLCVRATRSHGTPVGILPRGTLVTLSKREGNWGQISNDPGALYPPTVGAYVASSAVIGKWIFLGKEHGHTRAVVRSVLPDSLFDRVNVVPEERRVKVRAGDVMGYPGRYDSLRDATSTKMVHLEVFCGDGIQQFINAGTAWVNANCMNGKKWSELGQSPEPTMLRVDRGTTLYHDHGQPGTDPKRTDVIQVSAFATLPQDANHMFMETAAGNDGTKRRWWKVDGADALRNPISGWVREQSFAGGRVTLEYAQSWIDFECHNEDHDPVHTIFATTADYVDYALDSDVPGVGSVGKLSPLMAALYRVLYPTGDGAQAAEELRRMGQNPQGSGFPWIAFRASRLIPKHESEWANPGKWQELVSAIEQRTGPKPEHEEEKKRIGKLVWWDEVRTGVAGFPGPDVYHIHPVALVGNFSSACIPIAIAKMWALTITSGFEGSHALDYGAVADNSDNQGMSYGVIQFAAGQGQLGPLLDAMRKADEAAFKGCFDTASDYPTLDSAITSKNKISLVSWAINQQANNSNWKKPFKKLAENPLFQNIQVSHATTKYHAGAMQCIDFLRALAPHLMSKVEVVTYCVFYDLAVQQGNLDRAADEIRERVAVEIPVTQEALIRIAVEERAKKATHQFVADCFSRRIGIIQQNTYTFTAHGITRSRQNSNFTIISHDAKNYVCNV